MNHAQRRAQKPGPQHPPVPTTWTEIWERCPFRTFVALEPGTPEDLLRRTGGAFAAIGGEPCAIGADTLSQLVEIVLGGEAVIVFGDRADLRDAAKAQIAAALDLAMTDAAGCA